MAAMAIDPTPIAEVLRGAVPDATIAAVAAVDMATITVDAPHVLDTLHVLRDHPALQFALLADVTAVDLLPAEPRFEIVYHLVCLGEAYAKGPAAPVRRLRLKVALAGADPCIASAVSVYPCANWPEREVFDLFGVTFEHHPDLRRILTPDDWEGYPLRKDYPVQIKKASQSWSPVQLSVEEFAENMRAQRARAAVQSHDTGTSRD
jgi:NADH-quinone oxidoreductase subunit C